jgi:hypothetical protein
MGITLLMSMGVAEAQFASPGLGFGVPRDRGAAGPTEPVDEFDPAICDDIAGLPNPPMSLEACRSMMAMQRSMKAASSDPNAVRPGDENLNCDQIVAEMRATGGPMMSQGTIAQNKQSADATLALMQKQNAETKGFVAGQVALGVGAAALGAVPYVGGLASEAARMVMDAREKSFEERQANEAAPVRAQSNQALTATQNEIGGAMQSNPRYARLMQLVAEKNCPPPPELAPPTP